MSFDYNSKHFNLITDDNFILDYLKDDPSKPFFLGRIGGNDFRAVAIYKQFGRSRDFNHHLSEVKNYCGYFDKDNNIENFFQYLETLYDCYKISDCFTNPCHTIPYTHVMEQSYILDFLKDICENKPVITYNYIEAIYPFLNDFKVFAEGKKILIVSPFSETIKYQYKRKDRLLKNYVYPDFELITYNTPITYNDNGDEIDCVQTRNWNEQAELMANDISKLDFDIALLSCSSYAMYLGRHIFVNIHKQAIYIGGVMNVFFNIKGERYDNYLFYTEMMVPETRMEAFEKPLYSNVKGGRAVKSESFRAYF